MNAERIDSDAWVDEYFGGLYDAIYREKGLLTAEMLEAELELVSGTLSPAAGPLLDLACGFGRHAVPLAGAGYSVFGIDRHRPFVRTARRDAKEYGVEDRAMFAVGDLRRLPLASGSAGSVALLFNSFGYLGARERWESEENNDRSEARDPNLAILSEIARVLQPGGRCLIDLPNREPLVALVEEQPVMMQMTDDAAIEEHFHWNEKAGVLRNETLFQVGARHQETGYYLRLYREREMRALCAGAGLTVLTVYGQHDGEPYDEECDRMILLAARP